MRSQRQGHSCNSSELNKILVFRNAVLNYTSNLVHENVHHYFWERERKEGLGKGAVDYSKLEAAIRTLVSRLEQMRVDFGQKSAAFSLLLLNWLFELFSDLCRQNHNRPYFNHQRPTPITLLKAFQQISSVADLLKLLERTFTSTLKVAPEKAIHAFVTAHKTFFNNFDWITMYITDSFPNDLAKQLLTSGAHDFQAFCSDLNKTDIKRIPQMQEEYAGRLRLISDIFLYMERNRKAELRYCFLQVLMGFMEKGDNLLETIFLVKLSITFPEIILFFADDIIQMVIDPRIADKIGLLSRNPSFQIAISYPVQLHNFTAKLLERASTNTIFRLVNFIGPLIYQIIPA